MVAVFEEHLERHFVLAGASAPVGSAIIAGVFSPVYLVLAQLSGAISTGAWRSLGHGVFGVRAPEPGRAQ
jgi:hypothetical protein